MKAVLLGLLLVAASAAAADGQLRVGSKRFTESYILGEIIAQSVPGGAEYRPGLGNTGIVYAALKAGSIDVYPEYTGTIAREILGIEGAFTLAGSPAPARARGAGRGCAPGLQQYLCAGHARGRSEAPVGAHAVRSRAPSGAEARAVAGIHRARRRLAGAQGRVWIAADAHGAGPRSRLRGHRGRENRCHGRLFHRRQDRALRLARARGRPRRISALRRGAALPARSAAAPAAGMESAAGLGRQDRRSAR